MAAEDPGDARRARCDALYQKGMSLIEGRIELEGERPLGPPGWFARWQLGRAVRCFEEIVAMDPDGWQSFLFLGKAYQRLGNHEVALDHLLKAHRLKPEETPLAKEVGMESLTLGRIPEAVAACEAAVKVRPKDAELLSKLAVAYCFAGRDKDAERVGKAAVDQEPEDKVSARVLDLVRAVASGTRPRPRRMSDLMGKT